MRYGMEISDTNWCHHEHFATQQEAVDAAIEAQEESPWCAVCVWDTELDELPTVDSLIWVGQED